MNPTQTSWFLLCREEYEVYVQVRFVYKLDFYVQDTVPIYQ